MRINGMITKGKVLIFLTNSLNELFKKMCGDQSGGICMSGEFVYWDFKG